MATIDEVLDKVNQILDAMVYRYFGGTSESNKWGEPVNRSVIVRQEQPVGSGSSMFAIEDLPISEYSIPCRNASDLTTVTLGTDQVLGRVSGNVVGIDISTLGGNHNILSTTHPDTLVDTVVRGDLIAGNATPKWSRLAKGVDDQFLRMSGSDPAWHTLVSGDLPSHTHTEADISDLQDYVRITGDTMTGNLGIERISGIHSPTFVYTRYSAGSTNVKDRQSLGVNLYKGYDGTAEELGAIVAAIATQDWTVSAHGCEFEVYVTPDDSVINTLVLGLSAVGATFAVPVKTADIENTGGATYLRINVQHSSTSGVLITNDGAGSNAHLLVNGLVKGAHFMMGANNKLTDSDDSDLMTFAATDSSAVNNIHVAHAQTGLIPEISAVGSDPNIGLKLSSKGTEKLDLNGLKWPNVDGSANQFLQTNGSTVLSWADAGGKTKRAHTFYYANPQSGKSYPAGKFTASATIDRVDHIAMGGDLDYNIEIRDEDDPESAGTEIWTVDKNATTTHSAVTSFNNDSIGAHQLLFVSVTALGTPPDGLYIGIESEDD